MKEYNVLQYGAVGDGATNDAFAIQHAIDDCAKNGGGRVVLQSGYVFYSDSIRLRSKVDLHIQKGARLKATGNIDGYIRPNKLINDPKTALIGNPVTGKPSFVFLYGMFLIRQPSVEILPDRFRIMILSERGQYLPKIILHIVVLLVVNTYIARHKCEDYSNEMKKK